MEQNMPTSDGKNKKIIIIAVVALILLLAVVTVLKKFNQAGGLGLMGDVEYRGSNSMTYNSPVPSMKSAGASNGSSIMESAVAPEADIAIDTVDKKIIKNGTLNLRVNSVDNASQEIASIAKANNGEVSNSNFYRNVGNVKSGSITVKVPVANFETTFSQLKKVATLVIQESTSGQDVTEQYTDLQSRLKNKQAEEQAFAKILERSGAIDDVLKVTRELARVRGEIEILQGRIKLLESQTDMSTISASLTEDQNVTISDSWRPWQVVKETFNSLLKDIQKFVNFLIVLVIQVIPVLVLYLLIFYVIYRIGKKIYLKVKNR
jgi:hypothetical protein